MDGRIGPHPLSTLEAQTPGFLFQLSRLLAARYSSIGPFNRVVVPEV